MKRLSDGCYVLCFTIETMKRTMVMGRDSYIFRGRGKGNAPEVFNVPCDQCSVGVDLMERKPGTMIRRNYTQYGKLVSIQVVRWAKKPYNSQSRRRIRRSMQAQGTVKTHPFF